MTTRFARCTDNAIRHYQRETGGHYFDADTIRYFSSKVGAIFEADETLELPALLVISNADRRGDFGPAPDRSPKPASPASDATPVKITVPPSPEGDQPLGPIPGFDQGAA